MGVDELRSNAPEAIRLLRSLDNARGLVVRGIITALLISHKILNSVIVFVLSFHPSPFLTTRQVIQSRDRVLRMMKNIFVSIFTYGR